MAEILFLVHRAPWPPDRGDRIRSWHMFEALAKLAPVHVAALADNAAEAEIARTQKAVEEGLAHLKETLDHMTTTINEAIMAMLSAHDGKMVTVRAI